MSLKIIKAGLLDSIQDEGRRGWQHLGINRNGAMDAYAAAVANALLGKNLNDPVLECHFPAAAIEVTKPAMLVITGADFQPYFNENPLPLRQPFAIKSSGLIQFRKKIQGARCYLSALNGLQLKPWLNSFSTNLKASVGGWQGRRLMAGDELPFAQALALNLKHDLMLLPWKAWEQNKPEKIKLIAGPEWHWLAKEEQEKFLNSRFKISPNSDRMAYRLQGEPISLKEKQEMVSSAVGFGTIQLLPHGSCLVLMADHPTTGGYPRLAQVISTHLSHLAQLNPHDELSFEFCTVEEAEASFCQQQNYLHKLQNTCKLKLEKFFDADGRY